MSTDFAPNQACRPAATGSRVGAVLALVWAALLLADLGLIARYGQNVPLADDWYLVSRQHWNIDYWGWRTLHNEHRLPLPRGIIVALHWLTGMDFRAEMVLSAGLLGLAAAVLMRAAARARGRASAADVFFPCILLAWAHAENLLMSWQVQFTLSIALASVALAAVAAPRPRSVWLAGVCMLALPLCGTNGVLFAVPLAIGLVWSQRTKAGMILAAATLALCGAYFIDYHPQPAGPRAGHDPLVLRDALVEALGPAGLVGCFCAMAAVAVAWRRQPGMAVCLAGFALMPAAIAWARAGTGEISTRHALLLTPLWCASYLALLRTGKAAVLMAYLAIAYAALSVPVGLNVGKARAMLLDPIRSELRAGMPAEQVVTDRLTGPLGWFEPSDAPYLVQCIDELRARLHPCTVPASRR